MIRIWKIGDNGTVTVATDCLDAADFMRTLADAVIEYAENAYPPACENGEVVWAHDLHHDMPQILTGAFEIMCKLRGYKAEVGEQRMLYSGHAMPPIEDGRPYVECR